MTSKVCGFCKGGPVGDAATWLDGKPRPPAPCPRCGETHALEGARWHVGDEVYIPSLEFAGRVHYIVDLSDPVIVVRDKGGAELTMRASALMQEVA